MRDFFMLDKARFGNVYKTNQGKLFKFTVSIIYGLGGC